MKKTSTAGLEQEYDQLRRRLSQIGYVSQGSVQDRTHRTGGGAGYQWTRKVAQKTVTVTLTAEQFEQMKAAVENYRLLRKQLRRMKEVSRKIIFLTTPHPNRRTSLSKKVLGIK